MTQKIEDASRGQIAGFLPDAIARALTSYQAFSERNAMQGDDEDSAAKNFSSHHSACKVAIAHIELLLKLARWADLPHVAAGTHNDQIMLAGLMQEAEEELSRYRNMEET